jgi:hypothetical protein
MSTVCSPKNLACVLIGEADAKYKGVIDYEAYKNLSPDEQYHYQLGYTRQDINQDMDFNKNFMSQMIHGTRLNAMYMSAAFRTPRELFGDRIVSPVSELMQHWVSNGASIDLYKNQIVPQLKAHRDNILPQLKGAQKSLFNNYINDQILRVDYGSSTSGFMALINKANSSLTESLMKWNIDTAFLHTLTVPMRGVSLDADALGYNVISGLMQAIKNAPKGKFGLPNLAGQIEEVKQFGSYGDSHDDLNNMGLLHAADTVQANIMHYAAKSKFGANVAARKEFESYATLRYELGNEPTYFINHEIRDTHMFNLGRFAIRELLDPISHLMAIKNYTQNPTDQGLKTKAILGLNYLLASSLIRTVVFGPNASIQGLPGIALKQAHNMAHMFNENIPTADEWNKSVEENLTVTINGNKYHLTHLLKYGNLDYSHQHETIPFAFNYQYTINFLGSAAKTVKSMNEGNPNKAGEYLMTTLANGLPYLWPIPEAIRNKPMITSIKAMGRAVSGKIDYTEIVPDFVETTFDLNQPITGYGRQRKAYIESRGRQ